VVAVGAGLKVLAKALRHGGGSPEFRDGELMRRKLLVAGLAFGIVLVVVWTTRPPERVTIDVMAKWTGEEEQSFNSVITTFVNGRKTETVVRYHAVRNDIGEELDRRVAKGGSFQEGGPPDAAIVPQPGTMTALAGQKALVPLEDIVGDVVGDDDTYAPLWRRLGSVNGTLYGLWFKANHKSALWYRAQVLQSAGVTPPRNWEELQAAATRLAQAGITPLAVGGGDAWTLTDWFENIYLQLAGGEAYAQLACRGVPFTDTTVKEALSMMAQLLGRREWVAGGVDAVSITYEKSVEQVFGDPTRAAMMSGANYTSAQIAKYASRADARYFDFPSIRRARPTLVLGGDVAILLKDTKAGRDFIRFLATPNAAEPWARAGGFLSPNKKVNPAIYPNEVFSLAQAVREAGVANDAQFDLSDQFPPSYGGTDGKGMYKYFQDLIRDPNSVDSTAARLEEGAALVKARCPA
jgi:alpha-glucoside transport system substrate-binding protein